MTESKSETVDLARNWMDVNGIGPSDIAPYMDGDTHSKRYLRAWRFYHAKTRRTASRIAALLRCATEKLGRRVTYEEVFGDAGGEGGS